MLDMGFLPDIRRVLRHLPKRRQTLFFSATMPGPIADLSREMLHEPIRINIERQSMPATGITQAVPRAAAAESAAALRHASRRRARRARVHQDEAPCGSPRAVPRGAACVGAADPREPVAGAAHRGAGGLQVRPLQGPGRHGYRRTRDRRDGARARHQLRCARGSPRITSTASARTARAELTGSAFTLVAPEEEGSLRDIELGDRQTPSAGDDAGFRRRVAARRGPRGAPRAAHRGDSGTQGRGSRTSARQCRAPGAGPQAGRDGWRARRGGRPHRRGPGRGGAAAPKALGSP